MHLLRGPQCPSSGLRCNAQIWHSRISHAHLGAHPCASTRLFTLSTPYYSSMVDLASHSVCLCLGAPGAMQGLAAVTSCVCERTHIPKAQQLWRCGPAVLAREGYTRAMPSWYGHHSRTDTASLACASSPPSPTRSSLVAVVGVQLHCSGLGKAERPGLQGISGPRPIVLRWRQLQGSASGLPAARNSDRFQQQAHWVEVVTQDTPPRFPRLTS